MKRGEEQPHYNDARDSRRLIDNIDVLASLRSDHDAVDEVITMRGMRTPAQFLHLDPVTFPRVGVVTWVKIHAAALRLSLGWSGGLAFAGGCKPVIRGTRIPVGLILRKLSEGASEADLTEAYPRLTREDIQAAIRYANRG